MTFVFKHSRRREKKLREREQEREKESETRFLITRIFYDSSYWGGRGFRARKKTWFSFCFPLSGELVLKHLTICQERKRER